MKSYHKVIPAKLPHNPHSPNEQAFESEWMPAILAAAKINITRLQFITVNDPRFGDIPAYEVTYEYQFRQDEKYNWATNSAIVPEHNQDTVFTQLSDVYEHIYNSVIATRVLIEGDDPGTYNYLTAPPDAPFNIEDYTSLQL